MASWLAIAGLTIGLTLVAERRVRNALLGAALVAATTVALFQLGAFVAQGFLEPFWMIAVATSGVVTFVVSLVTYLGVRRVRSRARHS